MAVGFAVLRPWEEGGAPAPAPGPELWREQEPSQSPPANTVPAEPDGGDRPGMEPPEEAKITVNWDGVWVNESEGPSVEVSPRYYDPEIYSSESWGEEEAIAYYGWMLAPPYIPEGLTGGGHGVSAAIWRERATGQIVQDQAGRSFRTSFGEDGLPVSDDDLSVPTGFTVRASKSGILHCGLIPVSIP